MPPAHDAVELLSVVVAEEPACTVIALRGELDMSTCDLLRPAIERAAGGERPVIVDLSELDFMDASGLRLVLDAHSLLGGRLTLRPAPPRVQRLFALTGLERELPFAGALGTAADPRDAENVRYVRELWDAFHAGGIQALMGLVPQTARWHAYRPGEETGAEAVNRFWQTTAGTPDAGAAATPTRIEAIDGDVIVRSELPVSPARTDVFWSVYVFEGRTLVRAISFGSERAARQHAAHAHRGQ